MGQLPFTMGGFYSSLAYVIFIRLQYFWGQFWLQIVGTFQAETDEEIAYGLVHPLASWDPIWTQVRTFTGTKHKSNKLHMVWFVEPCTSARFPIWKAMKWWCVLPPRLHLDAKFLSPIDLVIEDSLVIWDTVLVFYYFESFLSFPYHNWSGSSFSCSVLPLQCFHGSLQLTFHLNLLHLIDWGLGMIIILFKYFLKICSI